MVDFSSVYSNLQSGAPDPSKILGVIDQVNKIRDFQSRQAVGEAYQQAIDPQSGLVDTGRFLGLLSPNPAAALRMPEAVADAAALQGQYIHNQTSQFNLNAGQTKFLGDLAGSYIGKKGGATDQDLATARTIAARNGIPIPLTEGILAGGPGDTRTPQQRFQDLNDFVMGPAGRSGPLSATGVVPAGQPNAGAVVQGTPGQAMRQATTPQGPGLQGGAQDPAMPPGVVTTMPPGFESRLTQSVDQMGVLQSAYDFSMTRKGMLGNLENDLQNFTSGPGADWTKVAKAWANRNVPMPKNWQFDPKSIASQEQFVKQASLLSQNQFQALGGTGSNAQFNASYAVNPNDTLSQLGNKGIIGFLKGNEDAIQAKFAAARADEKTYGTSHYPDFALDWNSNFDPRVFQFKYMPEKERKAYVASMPPDEQQQFAHSVEYAHQKGWVNYMLGGK